MNKEIEIPEGYEARIEGNKVIIEQKENEDEKIRKALLEFLNDVWHRGKDANFDKWGKADCAGWIAYLEKQKEQKPTEWTIDDAKPGDVLNSIRVQATIIYKGKADDGKHILAYCALQKGIFISQEMLWDRDFELASEYWKNALYEAIVRKGYDWDADKLELKKKEGKPAEWSEEDETMLERCISKMANIIPVLGKHGFTNMSFEKHTDEKLAAWLKSLPERFDLQPKQEWSEEEIGHLYTLARYIKSKGHEDDGEFLEGVANKLKSLRPPPASLEAQRGADERAS